MAHICMILMKAELQVHRFDGIFIDKVIDVLDILVPMAIRTGKSIVFTANRNLNFACAFTNRTCFILI